MNFFKSLWMRVSFLCSVLFLLVGVTACHQKPQAPQVVQAIPSQSANPSTVVAETAQEKSCKEFVQRFYDWYFDRLNLQENRRKGSPTSEEEVLNLKPSVLTPSLRQMLKDDSGAQGRSPGYIVGLDFDPYIGAQDWNGKYTVQRVTVKDETCRAVLFGDDAGTQVEMVDPELKNVDGSWTFVNFHYPNLDKSADENLISVLNTLQEERQKHKAKAAHQ